MQSERASESARPPSPLLPILLQLYNRLPSSLPQHPRSARERAPRRAAPRIRVRASSCQFYVRSSVTMMRSSLPSLRPAVRFPLYLSLSRCAPREPRSREDTRFNVRFGEKNTRSYIRGVHCKLRTLSLEGSTDRYENGRFIFVLFFFCLFVRFVCLFPPPFRSKTRSIVVVQRCCSFLGPFASVPDSIIKIIFDTLAWIHDLHKLCCACR